MPNFVRATEAFTFTSRTTGLPRVVTPGALFDASDPDLKGKEHLFEPVENHVERMQATRARAVETASAAPGEKRVRSRSLKAVPKVEPKKDSE